MKYFGSNYAFLASFVILVVRVDFVALLLSLVVFRARFGLTGSVIWSMTSAIALVAFRATLPAPATEIFLNSPVLPDASRLSQLYQRWWRLVGSLFFA